MGSRENTTRKARTDRAIVVRYREYGMRRYGVSYPTHLSGVREAHGERAEDGMTRADARRAAAEWNREESGRPEAQDGAK